MQKQIKAIIVDDEKLAIEDLENILNDFRNDIEIVGNASNLKDAVELVKAKTPELIFLDIQLKGESGFDLLEVIDDKIRVIFITAYDDYAIKAFEVSAQDYLLKPVNPDRLKKSIERLITNENQETYSVEKLKYSDSVFISLNNKFNFLKLNSIVAITAAGDYSEIHTLENKRKLSTKLMREWSDRLPESYFCRIHRSTIINLEYLEKIEEWFNQSYSVYMKGEEKPFAMSRGYAAKLKNMF
ncbi:MAG: LytTR family DNA-binding domain-containing protein [Bacteroidetes bacterium]|nr:LytTR family DNA-binding domain-containing protein [Bacteroidota bacterium]MBU1113707.1 LytTR family DNA-binding domain-containing protein [Bacteroidota bacterium]MBU1798062.1 LytTR family DNA-binding domain-containing protein [Bacteroidota bacterium]